MADSRDKETQYIEIVNWKRAQPTMPEGPAQWLKLYPSLLHHDGFAELDDASRVLLVCLWMLAAETGRHVLPADPKWLRRSIPILNSEPDLRPLLEAKNAYGEPTPFLRIVDKAGIYNIHNTPRIENKSKSKSKSKTKPLRASEKKIEKKKRNASATADAVVTPAQDGGQSKRETQKQIKRQTKSESQTETKTKTRMVERDPKQAEDASRQTDRRGNPENPTQSEAKGAVRANTPKAPSLATRHDPCRLGRIPIWWSDPACTAFSYAVFEALGLRCDPESRQGRDERGTFAAWLFETRARTPAESWSEIESYAVAKARELVQKRKGIRKPGALWLSVMHKAICPRAGPEAATG